MGPTVGHDAVKKVMEVLREILKPIWTKKPAVKWDVIFAGLRLGSDKILGRSKDVEGAVEIFNQLITQRREGKRKECVP
jgi:hypothetical protein